MVCVAPTTSKVKVRAVAARQLLHSFHRIAVRCVDHVGGAELHRELQLALSHVYGDDLGGVHQCGAHNYVDAHAPAADHRHGATGSDLGAVHHCSDARGHAAADQRRHRHGSGHVDGHAARFRHHGVLGEAGHLSHVVDALVSLVQPLGAVHHVRPRGHVVVAHLRVARQARLAASAGRHERQDHLLSGTHRGHAGANGLDCARALVAQHHRQGYRSVSVHEVAVAAADAGGADFNQHFPCLGVVQLHIFDNQGRLWFVKNGGLQFGPPKYQYRFGKGNSPSIFHPPAARCQLQRGTPTAFGGNGDSNYINPRRTHPQTRRSAPAPPLPSACRYG